jgi:hypothetical protein
MFALELVLTRDAISSAALGLVEALVRFGEERVR